MKQLTIEEVLRLPAMVDLITAARTLGIGRSKAYELARTGKLMEDPEVRVLKIGEKFKVSTTELHRAINLDAEAAQRHNAPDAA